MRAKVKLPTLLGVLDKQGNFLSAISSLDFKKELIEKYDTLQEYRKMIDIDKYSVIFVYLSHKTQLGNEAAYFVELFTFIVENERLEALKKIRVAREVIERKIKTLQKYTNENYKILFYFDAPLKTAGAAFMQAASPHSLIKKIYAVDGVRIERILYNYDIKDKGHGKQKTS